MPGKDTSPLLSQIKQGVLWLTINRVASANALSLETQILMLEALARAAADDHVRAVVLTATGKRVFCAGADQREVVDDDPARARHVRGSQLANTLLTLAKFPKPFLTSVQGKAVGAGCMLTVLSDEAICTPNVELSLPEIALGIPTLLGAAIVAARSNRSMVQCLVQAGRTVSAEDALAAGLIDCIVESDWLGEHTQTRAQALAKLPGEVYATNKAFINETLRNSLTLAVQRAGIDIPL